jgi:hypothetical protein
MERSMHSAQGSGRAPSRWLGKLLLSLALGSVVVSTVAADSPAVGAFPGTLTLHGETLTAQISAAPLRQVMEEVSRISRARVLWLQPGGEEPVSAAFTALPLPEALERILGKKNFLLFYASAAEGAQLSQIWISSEGTGAEPPPQTLPPVPPGLAPPPAPHAPLVEQPLDASIDTLIQAGLRDPNPVGRLNAVMQLGGYAREDPRTQAIFSHMAQSDDDPGVREIVSEILRNRK